MRKSQLRRKLLIIVHYLHALRIVLRIMRDPFLVAGYAFSAEWNQSALSRGLRFTFIATRPSKCWTWILQCHAAIFLSLRLYLYEGTQKEIRFGASVLTAACASASAVVAQARSADCPPQS